MRFHSDGEVNWNSLHEATGETDWCAKCGNHALDDRHHLLMVVTTNNPDAAVLLTEMNKIMHLQRRKLFDRAAMLIFDELRTGEGEPAWKISG